MEELGKAKKNKLFIRSIFKYFYKNFSKYSELNFILKRKKFKFLNNLQMKFLVLFISFFVNFLF